MNEEELKKRREYLREGETDGDFLNWCDKVDLYEKGFQKGKLEQKKEDLKVIEKSRIMWINYVDITESPFKKKWKVIFNDLHKQLQKEVGDDSQTRQSKETSVEKGGGKAERYLFNSDNVSSADTLKLNHKCPVCDKDIYLRDDTVNEKGVIYHLGCYLFENHFTINDSLKDIWDNPEDDRWDKEEEKQDE